MSILEDNLYTQMQQCNVDLPEREYRLFAHYVGMGRGLRARLLRAGLRDWRFDFAWPSRCIAIEVQGGTWSSGSHVRGRGYESDCEKSNAAQMLGWRVYQVTTDMITDGRALRLIERILEHEQFTGATR